MNYLSIKNWERFQQCDRRAPWIKLYTNLLQNYDFLNQTDTDKALFCCILLYAGQAGNKIPNDGEFLRRVFCLSGDVNLNRLIDAGFLVEYNEDTASQANDLIEKKIESRKEKDRRRVAEKRMSESDSSVSESDSSVSESDSLKVCLPETETETETERITQVTLTALSIEHISDWLEKKRACGKYLTVDEHRLLEKFKDYCRARKKRYSDYVAAFRNAFEWDNAPKRQATRSDGGSGMNLIREAMQ